MPHLAIDATCLPQYDKLDRPTRERLIAVTRKFRELPLHALMSHPDLRIRPLTAGQDPRIRTFRISDNWTGVMLAPESGETFLLVHLLPRDSAEEWAGDQRHDVNSVMGTLERRDATALERASSSRHRAAPDTAPPPPPRPSTAGAGGGSDAGRANSTEARDTGGTGGPGWAEGTGRARGADGQSGADLVGRTGDTSRTRGAIGTDDGPAAPDARAPSTPMSSPATHLSPAPGAAVGSATPNGPSGPDRPNGPSAPDRPNGPTRTDGPDDQNGETGGNDATGAEPTAGLLSHVSDRDLARLGVDPEIRDFCRSLSGIKELRDWRPALPQDQYEVISALAEGHPVARVLDEVVAPRRPVIGAVATDDYDTAIRHTRERVIVIGDDQEIEDILAGEFNAWRIYLHPKQRDLAYRARFNGPAKVSGGPGTGKTVVALHRVKYLAEHLPLDGRVLLTSFTNALVESLKRNLALLLPAELVADVDVVTTDKLALDVVKEEYPDVRLRTDTRGVFANITRQHRLPFPVDFLFSEYRHVIMAQGITTLDGYLDPDARRGRTLPLSVPQRRQVWQSVSEARAMMRNSRRLPAEDLHAEAARILDSRPGKPYTNLVVDEAQDLHPAQWRTLRAAVTRGHNDMFIAGDNRQRIYDNTVSFRRLGIAVVGRSYPLRVNYRTTEEILTWADGIMRGRPVTELGESAPEPAGSTSCVLSGPPPELHGAADEPAELDALAERVRRWLADGIAPGDICVTARTNRLRDSVTAHLRARSLPASMFNPGKHAVTDAAGTVRVTTMHGVKGLEFRAVAVTGATATALPQMDHVTSADLDEHQHQADLDAQRSLLYVACTRAREHLYISWHGTPSPFLPL
ncbi:UvrD-helicase domain-containing protein [Nocardiopsis mangrovi]|uniref:DNA 3'-5' helicase n=1 Tax=Nocardiopsis mangrovi TaxID=1179818 RepID=A0ABV9DWQ3_9ACTN